MRPGGGCPARLLLAGGWALLAAGWVLLAGLQAARGLNATGLRDPIPGRARSLDDEEEEEDLGDGQGEAEGEEEENYGVGEHLPLREGEEEEEGELGSPLGGTPLDVETDPWEHL